MENKNLYEFGREYNLNAMGKIAEYALEKLKNHLLLEQSDIDAILQGDDWVKMIAFQKMWSYEIDCTIAGLHDLNMRKLQDKLSDDEKDVKQSVGVCTKEDTDNDYDSDDYDSDDYEEDKTYARDADIFYFMKRYVEGFAFERFKDNTLVQEFMEQFLDALQMFGDGEYFVEDYCFNFTSRHSCGSSSIEVRLESNYLEVLSYGYATGDCGGDSYTGWTYSLCSDGTVDGEASLETVENELKMCTGCFLSICSPSEYCYDEEEDN